MNKKGLRVLDYLGLTSGASGAANLPRGSTNTQIVDKKRFAHREKKLGNEKTARIRIA